jgi:DNA-binding protein H-NS
MNTQKNLEDLLQKRKELDKLITDAKKMATKMARVSKARVSVIRDIAVKMIEYEIKTEDIDAAVKALISSGGVQAVRDTKKVNREVQKVTARKVEVAKVTEKGAKAKRGVLAPKYRDSTTGKTWSGRGLQPLWFRDALNKGAKPEDLQIRKGKARRG